MPEALDVHCPTCDSHLKIDADTGAVVWVEKKKEAAKSFDDLLARAHGNKSVLDEKFARSVAQNKNAKEILDRKFEEAKKRAAENPNERPPHPFDLD
jgi:hypothetical protein